MSLRGVVLLGALALAPGAPQANATRPAATPLSLDECISQIDRLASEVRQLDEQRPSEGARVLSEVPEEWTISTSERRWTISAEWLQRDLEAWQRQPEAPSRARIADRLLAVRSQMASYRVAP